LTSGRWRRETHPRWRLILVGAVLVFLRLFSPPAIPVCGFQWLTGLLCPLCGMTRGLCALAKGNWSEAIGYHALSPLVLAAMLGVLALDAARLLAPRWRAPLPAGIAANVARCGAMAGLVYAVARNL
jgi:hypothetical protein